MSYKVSESPLFTLLKEGKHFTLPKGQVVNALDDRAMLNLINKGYIKRYLITKDGTRSIQTIYGPGDIFPLTPVYKTLFQMDMYRGPEEYYYEAMTPIDIYSINQETLHSAVAKNPIIYRDLFYSAGLRLNSYIHRLESSSLRVSNRKIVHQLLYYAEIFGEKTENGVLINLPLTHQNLADVLNLARETVSNCLSRLEQRGLLKGGKNILIPNTEELRHSVR